MAAVLAAPWAESVGDLPVSEADTRELLGQQAERWRPASRIWWALAGAAAVMVAAGTAVASSWRATWTKGSRTRVAESESSALQGGGIKCLGTIAVEGHGNVSVISAGENVPGDPAGVASVEDGKVKVGKSARVYFGDRCEEGPYDHNEFSKVDLLGRRFSFTVDLSGAQCGCVAAMYFVPMYNNWDPGECNSDYYCDAASVCGVPCAEFDVMEANTRAFRSTAHRADDAAGLGKGIGGGFKDLSSADYGPGAQRIDTGRPFSVAIDVDGGQSFRITMSQEGRSEHLELDYTGLETDMAGMTPVLSYWYKSMDGGSLQWFDSGVCAQEDAVRCAESVAFAGFSLDPADAPPTPAPTAAAAPPRPPTASPTEAPTPLPTTAAPTSAPTAQPTAAPPPTTQPYMLPCFKAGVKYTPSLPGTLRTVTAKPADCQLRCLSVVGCSHFTFSDDGGCELQGEPALAEPAAGIFTAGPPRCSDALSLFAFLDSGYWDGEQLDADATPRTCEDCATDCVKTPGCSAFSTRADCADDSVGACKLFSTTSGKDGVSDSTYSTFVMLPGGCYSSDVRYDPSDSSSWGGDAMQIRTVQPSAAACQRRCSSISGCAHFSFWPDGGCHLRDADATSWVEDHVVSGPRECRA